MSKTSNLSSFDTVYNTQMNLQVSEDNNDIDTEVINKATNINLQKTADIFNLHNCTNPRTIWGAVVTLLHKQNLMALFTACGEIREIKLEAGSLIINIREEFLYNTLTKEDNFVKIFTLLKQVNNKLDLKFNLIKKKDDITQINLKRLEEVFGESLEVID